MTAQLKIWCNAIKKVYIFEHIFKPDSCVCVCVSKVTHITDVENANVFTVNSEIFLIWFATSPCVKSDGEHMKRNGMW